MTAGDLELLGLGLQLPEQACIDDGQRRLGGEGLEQLGHLGWESARAVRRRITSTPTILSPRSMRNREHRAPAVPEQDVQMRVEFRLSEVGNLERPVGECGPTDQSRFPVDRDRPQLLQ